MSYSGAYSQQVGIGSHGLQRRTTAASGTESLGNSPGHYSMAASARGVGSYPSHRPGVTHMEIRQLPPQFASMQEALIGGAAAHCLAAHKCYMLVYNICACLLEMQLSRISLTRLDRHTHTR